jgi:hypothetical protein
MRRRRLAQDAHAAKAKLTFPRLRDDDTGRLMLIERPLFRASLAFVWIAVWAYALTVGPADDPALTRALIRGVFTGHYGDIDPAIAAVFSALGVIPMLFAALLVPDGRGRRLPAWPFALGAFALGAFSWIPYFVFRPAGSVPDVSKQVALTKFLRSRGLAVIIVLLLVGLLGWGLVAGSASAYGRAFWSSRMVHVMTLDLAICAVLLWVIVGHLRRVERIEGDTGAARWVLVLPVFGPALWNALVRRSECPTR